MDVSVTSPSPDVSVVMPCLNEADTLAACVRKALEAFRSAGIDGEVLVADNGSTDGSPQIAESLGARVVPVREKGYGNALMGGIQAARGRYIIMGDADDSYDFIEVPKFVEELRKGYDLVMGCRLPSGGGTVAPRAMPFLHRWLGNPMFSAMARRIFRAPIHDVYCGMRGFTREHYERLGLRFTGMEFATEMVVKSSLLHAKISEVPITLHPNGRKTHAQHLKTFSDGWRTLRFFMLYSPRALYLVPGLILMAIGALGYLVAYPGITVGRAVIDVHTLLLASLLIIMGYQGVVFALLAKIFAVQEHILPEDARLTRFFQVATLEKALVLSAATFLLGAAFVAVAAYRWYAAGFGRLDYPSTMRIVIPGVLLATIGSQSIMGSFFASILGMHRK